MKTLINTTVKQATENIPDLKIWGDGDAWKLICKASSKDEGWMKSTKAMEIPGMGCLVQVTTQQGDHVAEALCFIPGVRIVEVQVPENASMSEAVRENRQIYRRRLEPGLPEFPTPPGDVIKHYSEVGENPHLTEEQKEKLDGL